MEKNRSAGGSGSTHFTTLSTPLSARPLSTPLPAPPIPPPVVSGAKVATLEDDDTPPSYDSLFGSAAAPSTDSRSQSLRPPRMVRSRSAPTDSRTQSLRPPPVRRRRSATSHRWRSQGLGPAVSRGRSRTYHAWWSQGLGPTVSRWGGRTTKEGIVRWRSVVILKSRHFRTRHYGRWYWGRGKWGGQWASGKWGGQCSKVSTPAPTRRSILLHTTTLIFIYFAPYSSASLFNLFL